MTGGSHEMNGIQCEVIFEKDDEEITVGHLRLFSIPRVDEYIWFSEKRQGHSSWIVTEVAYHVGSGKWEDTSIGYQTAVLYVKPTRTDG